MDEPDPPAIARDSAILGEASSDFIRALDREPADVPEFDRGMVS